MTTSSSASSAKSGKGSLKARKTAARLLGVQAVYQALQNNTSPAALYEEYIRFRSGMELEEGHFVEAEPQMFQSLVSGVTERFADLQQIIRPRVQQGGQVEPLLTAILLCGTYELLVHQDIDKPIIIADYLDITAGFFEQNEPKLVNGILDAIAKEVRN